MTRPLILFSAVDSHNLGNLLFARIATALLPEPELIYAGLATRCRQGLSTIQRAFRFELMRPEQRCTLRHG
jgi:hypothetical protein